MPVFRDFAGMIGRSRSVPPGEQATISPIGGRRGSMIKKVKEGYKVLSEKSGKNLGGPYKTKAEAKKRLQ